MDLDLNLFTEFNWTWKERSNPTIGEGGTVGVQWKKKLLLSFFVSMPHSGCRCCSTVRGMCSAALLLVNERMIPNSHRQSMFEITSLHNSSKSRTDNTFEEAFPDIDEEKMRIWLSIALSIIKWFVERQK
jgi:hypothetical protein